MLLRVGVILVALGVALASTAHAKYAFQGLVTTSGGWTNNANAAQQNQPGLAPASGFFGIVSPGVVFTSGTPRAVLRLGYTFSTQFYANNPDLTTYANQLSLNGYFTPSPLTELLIGVAASQSQLNTVNQLTIEGDSSAAPLTITRVGRDQFFGVSASETFLYAFKPVARFIQTLGFSTFIPLAQGLGQTYSVAGGLGLERSFRKDAFGGQLTGNWVYFAAQHGPVTNPDGTVNPNGEIVGVRQQVLTNLVGRWRRDFGNFWNTQIDAGVVMVISPTAKEPRAIFQPTGLLAIRYLHPKGSGELSYSHSVAPNALVQQTFAMDSVSLRGSVPFPEKSKMSFAAGAGYAHGRNIDAETGFTTTSVDIFLVDATLSWAPFKGLGIFTRYSFNAQLGNPDNDPPIADFLRHVVLVGLSGTYPTEAAATIPTRIPMRVDRSDFSGIPNPHSQPAVPR